MDKYREILKIGIPIMLGQACVIILAFADNIMIGWHSVTELAASSFVNNMMNLFILIELGFATGMTPVIGADYGKKNIAGIGKTLRNGISLNTSLGAIGTVIILGIYPFLDCFGQKPELLPYIRPYYLLVGVSTLFVLGFNTLKQFTDGICSPAVSMLFLMGGNLLNIFGNWVLIYGKLGFPELGLAGAGISTLAARIIMLAGFAYYIFKGRRMEAYASAFKSARSSGKEMRNLFNLGYPLALQMGMETSTFTFSAVMVGWIGATALAAHQVALTISQLFFMMMQGLAFAVSILVSTAYGKKDIKGVREYARKGYLLILCISFIFSAVVYIFRHQAVGMFTDSAEVSAIALSLIFVLFSYQFGDGLQLCYANALRGIQDVKPIMSAAFVSYFLIAMPLSWALGFKTSLGIVGIWIGFPVGLTTAGVFFYIRFRKRLKMLIFAE
ncbi:MAG: MATE family efflux transporter [Candidatus Cryptobacteroides sp.]